jgi:hypothetical protein
LSLIDRLYLLSPVHLNIHENSNEIASFRSIFWTLSGQEPKELDGQTG